jgi:hypothetical protein
MNNEDISVWKRIHVLAVRVKLLYEFRTKTNLKNFTRPSPAVLKPIQAHRKVWD